MKSAPSSSVSAPAVLNRDQAFAYLGGHRSILFALLELGYVEPCQEGHKSTLFLRAELDRGLDLARGDGRPLRPSAGVKSIAQALAKRREKVATNSPR